MMSYRPTLTEADINLLENRFKRVFATKEELTQLKSDLLDKLDAIFGEVVATREEISLLSAHSREHFDRIEALEKIHPELTDPAS